MLHCQLFNRYHAGASLNFFEPPMALSLAGQGSFSNLAHLLVVCCLEIKSYNPKSEGRVPFMDWLRVRISFR